MTQMERRVKLNKGQQRDLISKACFKLGSLKKLSASMNISYSTLKKYKQESLLLPEGLFNRLVVFCDLTKMNFFIKYLDANWGRKLGAKRGMAVLEKKYPEKIIEWRRKAIKKSAFSNMKKIKIPLLNESFAELIGAYLGDGTLTKYFIRISGDYRYDIPYYNHLNRIIYELFGINAAVYRDKNSHTAYLVIFSKQLCDYFSNEFGLKKGDKIRNNSIIPLVIMKDKSLSLACLRGLVDTDGSVSRRGRNGEQFTVTFTSHNPCLIKQVKLISDRNSLFSFISERRGTIGTNNQEKIRNYFRIVGSSNLKHIIRFHQKFFFNKSIYLRDTAGHIKRKLYKGMNLPFKLDR